MALSSCSTRKNTALSRNYQAFITRYNIYFNGDEHYKETIKSMERSYEDDYSGLVFMHPAEAYSNPKAPQPTGNFDRSIEKAQKSIQLRSIKKRPKKKSGKANDPKYKEWLKRDEYNPFLHNSWMMMGRSQYLNGDYLGAASTFYYTSRHFSWLPATVTEAKLWQARSYCSLDWLVEAENILIRIKEPELTNNTLRELYNFTFANYHIKSHDYEKAVPYLTTAIKYADGSQKTRLNFLLGQIYALLGKKQEAYEAFKKAGSASSATYRTKFNARIKQSEVYSGDDIESEVKALKRMTRYDRNKEYLDQVYYAIGNLYLSRQDTAKAIENYILAAEKSTRNGIDKAISQITLGELYFKLHSYDKAQPCYAEAVPVLPETYPDYDLLKRRSDVLDELAIYSQNVTLQDSLLRLSEMTPEQQRAVIDKIIRELKEKEKKEAEDAAREEYLAQQAAQGNNLQNSSASAPNSFVLNTDKSWYFYNTATRNAGKTDFQKRWGSRKLEDDWRRRNKASFDMNDFSESSDDDESSETAQDDDTGNDSTTENGEMTNEEKEKQQREQDPHYPEYYLKQIPSTDEEKLTAHDVIQEGLYNMGVILKDKLEDYNAAATEFDRLLTRYPDNIYRLDTYYNLYLMFMREGKLTLAERYRSMILHEFAESKYGTALRDPNYIENLREMEEKQEQMYADTYEAYLNNDNDAVHKSYSEMMYRFPLSDIMPKFMFLHALAYVTEKKPEEFKETLKELLERYPDTDITPLASSYLKQLAQGRKLESSTSNMRGMLWDTRLTNDSTALAEFNDSIAFDLNPADPQLLILVFPTDTVSSNQLLFDIARHNFTSFVVKDFDLEQMNFGRLGLLIIKGFENFDELTHYRKVMKADKSLVIPRQVRPVMISAKNFDILLKQGRSFEEYFRYVEDKMVNDIHDSVLPPETYGTEEESLQDIPDIDAPAPETVEPAKPAADIDVTAPAQPQTRPESPAKPAPVEKPRTIPEYPEGSEGDDPLLDIP